jgi:hypothetical protein
MSDSPCRTVLTSNMALNTAFRRSEAVDLKLSDLRERVKSHQRCGPGWVQLRLHEATACKRRPSGKGRGRSRFLLLVTTQGYASRQWTGLWPSHVCKDSSTEVGFV